MCDTKYTIEEVVDRVNLEGLDYAIQHYLSDDKIDDPKLAHMWSNAKAILNEIENYLEEEMRKKDPNWEWD